MVEIVDKSHENPTTHSLDLPAALGTRAAAAVFYDDDGNRPEVERLDRMATMANPISWLSLEALAGGTLSGSTVLDVGAGDSTSLGSALQSHGVTYVPIDKRVGAVNEQKRRFPLATVGDVADLPDLPKPPDYVHARFVAGWLPKRRRAAMLAAMLEQSGKGVIIDYDWSVADGPAEYVAAIQLATGIMRNFGFDPEYGAKSKEDITATLATLIGTVPADGSIRSERYNTMQNAPIKDALPVIEVTAQSIKEALTNAGMKKQVAQLDEALTVLRAHVTNHPGTPVTLPDIVATQFDVPSLAESEEKFYEMLRSSNRKVTATAIRPIVSRSDGSRSGPVTDIVTRDTARQVQAATYYFDGIINRDGIDPRGVLAADIDPDELVVRSDYIASRDEDGRLTAVIRMINASDGDPMSLPTVKRLNDRSPLAFAFLQEQGVFDDATDGEAGGVIEISGLARNFYHGEHESVVDAIVALGKYAKQKGVKHAVMGLQDKHVLPIMEMLGPEAMMKIPTEDASHVIKLPNVNEGIRFTAIYVDVQQFIDRVRKHAASNLDSTLARRLFSEESRVA